MIGKAANSSEFHSEHTVIVQRFGTNTAETAWLVAYSRFAIISIYEMWINDKETMCKCQDVGLPCVTKEKRRPKLKFLNVMTILKIKFYFSH